MTRNLNASWYTQRTINGFAVQWRLTEKTYVTAHPNQYGAFPSMSYPTDAIGNDDLFSEFKKAALHARYERSGLARYGDRFSDARERLCDLVVDELNQRGSRRTSSYPSITGPTGSRTRPRRRGCRSSASRRTISTSCCLTCSLT
ncbi:hypothetical protein ONR75_24150 [Rhodopseudomonas sp. P2A-2r]|uniref:hypothetical protein n=1 Tax=Rhodopseudomonas sp. P2A-2r TaxID=2991972 RepID=UPI00223441B4|nr:hypothetical protein [Rhodopseudomonas sp. P2A-2r]UZE47932.1 hypothetical protein ONR75_24150 [Rhodopseudomonas sp. P2A-2r]